MTLLHCGDNIGLIFGLINTFDLLIRIFGLIKASIFIKKWTLSLKFFILTKIPPRGDKSSHIGEILKSPLAKTSPSFWPKIRESQWKVTCPVLSTQFQGTYFSSRSRRYGLPLLHLAPEPVPLARPEAALLHAEEHPAPLPEKDQGQHLLLPVTHCRYLCKSHMLLDRGPKMTCGLTPRSLISMILEVVWGGSKALNHYSSLKFTLCWY